MAYQPLKPQHSVAVEPANTSSPVPHHGNPFQEGFQDINFDGGSVPVTTGHTSKHAPQWSSSTNTTVAASEDSSLKSKRKVKLPHSGTWVPEIVTLLVGLAAVASIIGVIARYSGRALPDWPHEITLNALIALLATVANATMSITLSSGISQSKWIRFKQTDTPLSDVEVYDEASRGSWGALMLLVKRRGEIFSSFGALLAILSLALGPFAQQIATYKIRSVESDVGAAIPRAMNYTGALKGNTSSTGYVPILPLKAAVYNGLFAENSRPAASLPFTCQSGNCAWEPFETLAVCHECIDISALATRYCPSELGASPNVSTCGWQVPQGARLNTSSDVFSMTSFIPSAYGDMPHSTLIRIIFMGTELHDVPDAVNVWAKQCSLQACVQTLSSSVVNGTLQEDIAHTTNNQTVVDMSSPDSESEYDVYIKGADNSYLLGMGALLSIRGWFGSIFTNGSATRTTTDFTRSVTDADRAVVVNLTVGISSGETFFDTDIVTAFYWNYYEYADGLNMLMSDLAVSMTTAFRGFTGAAPVEGKSMSMESYVHVRWGFAILPVAIVLATGLFLVVAMVLTRRSQTELWKSSALAMLFHGLDRDARAMFDLEDSLGQKKRQAKHVRVRLQRDATDGTLLRAGKMAD